jgi:flap endonuclease-1
MGVKGLFTIITTHANKSIETRHMSEYRGTTQALDASLILYKYCLARIMTSNDNTIGGRNNCHLDTCLHKTSTMLKYGIMPMWIFDGKSPEIKLHTVNKRRKVREDAQGKLADPNISEEDKLKYLKLATSLTKSNINDVKKLLDLLGITYIESTEEADAQCAELNINNVVDGVISEDWDLLLFGCEKLLKNFFNKTKVVEINVKILLQELNINLEQLIDLSALLGNDYCPGLIGMKPVDTYNNFKACNYDMDVFLKLVKDENSCYVPSNFIKLWQDSKKYYMNNKFTKIDYDKIIWAKPNYDELYKYLVIEKEFDRNIVINKINELRKMYTFYIGQNYKLGPYNVIRRLKGG